MARVIMAAPLQNENVNVAGPSSTTIFNIQKWKIGAACVGIGGIAAVGAYMYMRRKNHDPGPDEENNLKDQSKEDTEHVGAKGSIPSASTKFAHGDGIPKRNLNPLENARMIKDKGNSHFRNGDNQLAISCYTEAIKVCPKDKAADIATFYQNRAAAYEQMKEYQNVIDDCTEAIKLNKKYSKALLRRAKANEKLGKLQECLEDLTMGCMFEGFSNVNNLYTTERILKALATEKAKEYRSSENFSLSVPSVPFVRSYLAGFQNDPIVREMDSLDVTNVEDCKDAYTKALLKLKTYELDDIIPLCTDELESSDSTNHVKAALLRGTMYLLMGDHPRAIPDLTRVLEGPPPEGEQPTVWGCVAQIRLASAKMHASDEQTEAAEAFEACARDFPDSPDVFHQMGQYYILMDEAMKAIAAFKKCVEMDPEFSMAGSHLCFSEYRLATQTESEKGVDEAFEHFRKYLKKFPESAEVRSMFAQCLFNHGKFEEADALLVESCNIQPWNPTFYVHRAMAKIQQNDPAETYTEMLNKAVEVDPKSVLALETLGQLCVQKNELDEAVKLFDRTLALCRSEGEVANIFSLKLSAELQKVIRDQHGINLPLGAAASGILA